MQSTISRQLADCSPGKSWTEYFYAVKALEPFGLPLSSAVREYVAVLEKPGETSIDEAIECFCLHNSVDLPQKTTAEVAREMVEAKRRDGASVAYLSDLR